MRGNGADALWILACFMLMVRALYRPPAQPRHPVLIIGLLALSLRVPPLFFVGQWENDVRAFALVGRILAHGTDIYTSPLQTVHTVSVRILYPYLPGQLWWIRVAQGLSDCRHMAFLATAKLAPVLADVLLAMLVPALALSTGCTRRDAWRAGLVYAACPLPILVCAYHGQFDAEPTLCLVGAWLLLARHRTWPAALLIGVAIVLKTWPALVVVLFLRAVPRAERAAVAAVVVAPTVVALAAYWLLYHTTLSAILRYPLAYSGGNDTWGFEEIGALLQHGGLLAAGWLPPIIALLKVALALAVVQISRSARDPGSVWALLWLCLGFLAVTPGFYVQYLVWILPFVIAAGLAFRPGRLWLLLACLCAVAWYFLIDLYPWSVPPGTNAREQFPLAYWPYACAALGLWCIGIVWMLRQRGAIVRYRQAPPRGITELPYSTPVAR
jgi:hypothetical protein